MEIIVFNVLFKGVEIKINPQCQAFATYEQAEEWVYEQCRRGGFHPKSEMGIDEDNFVYNDFRVEDDEGNSYYFVVFKQKITQPQPDQEPGHVDSIELT